MKRYLNKTMDIVNGIYAVGAVIALICMVLFSSLQIASRYISSFKILGMEELARMSFVWMVSLGMSLAIASSDHPSIDMLVNLIHGKASDYYHVFIQLAIFVFMVVFFVFSIQKTSNLMALGQRTPLFSIPLQYVYSSLTFGAFGSALNAVNNIVNLISEARKPADSGEVET